MIIGIGIGIAAVPFMFIVWCCLKAAGDADDRAEKMRKEDHKK